MPVRAVTKTADATFDIGEAHVVCPHGAEDPERNRLTQGEYAVVATR